MYSEEILMTLQCIFLLACTLLRRTIKLLINKNQLYAFKNNSIAFRNGMHAARYCAKKDKPKAGPEASKMENKPALGAPVKYTSVEGITEYRLQNGLRVLMFPDNSKQTITVNITYMVGSKHENYGETGMAHLLEHLVFKGTPKHPNIPQELTAHGAQPNGTTWTDRTNYFETFNATEENLRWALDLEADRMINSYIAKKILTVK